MNYKEAWRYLDDLQFFKIKLGLESMAAFLARVGNPQDRLSFVHVAGTNGKGSVAMNLLTILAGAGYRVGLYTSPHLSSVRERFRINDHFISEEAFAEHASHIRQILAEEQITYFEFTTALALLWFASEQVDLVILEVGLGGRLDATNVVTPLVGVITNVSMDHEAYLGNSLTEVAGEKAGIIKPGIPLVSGVADDESRAVVTARCAALQAPFWLLGRDFRYEDNGETWTYYGLGRDIVRLRCNMRGDYQKGNSAQALAVVELLAEHGFAVDDETIRTQLALVHWPGRLESFWLDEHGCQVSARHGRYHYLLDGAHNPAGMASLVAALQQDFGYDRLICVWAAMADKDISTTLAHISPLCDMLILTRPESERSADFNQLRQALGSDFHGELLTAAQVDDALRLARGAATANNDLVLVAGSLYLVGAARKILLGDIVSG